MAINDPLLTTSDLVFGGPSNTGFSAIALRNEATGEIVVAYCTQHFFFAPLNGSVEVRYRRKYLGDWREIQAKTEQLLQSFIQR